MKERDSSEDVGIDGKIILKQFVNSVGDSGLKLCGSGYEPLSGFCEHGNELSGSI
jgi:hypothetical protein